MHKVKFQPDRWSGCGKSPTVLSRIDEDMTMAKKWDEIASRWTRFSRDVKKNWSELSDDEVMQVNGRREMLAEKIQARYGVAEEEANKQIDKWASKLRG
jgi:uncharacterized protein YjbJ (UPF0337 family)